MFLLPNGKRIDEEMVEAALDDGNLEHVYYLNTTTGEVLLISEYGEQADQIEEGEIGGKYLPIEHIPSHEAYQWMEQFVAEIVTPKDALIAEKLSIALMGKGAFRRFKDVLYLVGEEWVQAWYSFREEKLKQAMKQWFANLPLTISEGE
jgi:hypothetical protein